MRRAPAADHVGARAWETGAGRASRGLAGTAAATGLDEAGVSASSRGTETASPDRTATGCQAGLRARRVRRGPRQVGHGLGVVGSGRTAPGSPVGAARSRRLCGGCRAWLASQKWQVAWLGLAGRCCAHQRRRNGRRCRHGTSGRRPARGDWGRSGRDGSRNNRAPDGGDPIASASRGPQFRGLQHRHRWRRRYRRCHRRHSRRKRTKASRLGSVAARQTGERLS